MWWALIALAGIIWLTFTVYLDYKSKMAAKGLDDRSLEQLKTLEQELAKLTEMQTHLVRRIENMEAIVTTEEWDENPLVQPKDPLQQDMYAQNPIESDMAEQSRSRQEKGHVPGARQRLG